MEANLCGIERLRHELLLSHVNQNYKGDAVLGVRGSSGCPRAGAGVALKTQKAAGAQCSIHSARFLLMHFKAFQFFIRMQTRAVSPASSSTTPTSLSLKDSVVVHSLAGLAGLAARKQGWPSAVPCSARPPQSLIEGRGC